MLNFILLILAYLFMEFVAWFTHKYIMHGFLWSWHKDHHKKDYTHSMPEKTEERRFEKNDLFFLVYATPAIIFMLIGFSFQINWLVFIAVGITLYGFTYFVFHDIVMHKRLPIGFLFKLKGKYINALLRAHAAHHNPKNPEDFKSFGLLIFPKRFFKE